MRKKKKGFWTVALINLLKFVLRIVLFPFVLVFLIKKYLSNKKTKDKVAVFSMSQIDSLSGTDFEKFLCEVFEKLGYKVETTKASHDYGADLLVSKNGKLSVVQAKCYAGAVGIKAVQEIVSAKHHYNADDAIVATNNYFSKDAEILAFETDVKLIDRVTIENLLKKYEFKIEKTSDSFMATSEKSKSEINQRFGNMI